MRLKLPDAVEVTPDAGPTRLDQRGPAHAEVAHFIVVTEKLLHSSGVRSGCGRHACTGGDAVTQASHPNRFRTIDRNRGRPNGKYVTNNSELANRFHATNFLTSICERKQDGPSNTQDSHQIIPDSPAMARSSMLAKPTYAK